MTGGPTSTGLRLLDEIRRGSDYVARLTPQRSGVGTCTAATVRLLRPDGEVAWSGSATVASGAASVTIPGSATTSDDPGTGWLIEWTYTVTGGAVDTALNPADVVLYTVKPVATWQDLIDRHADLSRLIGADLTAAQAKGDQAWVHVVTQLRARGRRPCLIVDSQSLFLPHLLYWLHLHYADLDTGDEASSEARRAARYAAEFAEHWGTLTWEVADPSTWRRTGERIAPRGVLWAGSSGQRSFRPVPSRGF